jgi:hypothetical protein
VLSVSLPRNEPGPLGNGYPRSLYASPGGIPHPTYEVTYLQAPVPPWGQPGISVRYDASQQPSVDPSPCSGHLPSYSIQSTNEPYPLGFRPRLIPVPLAEACPPSLGPTDVYYASLSREAYFQATPGPSTPLTRTTFSRLPCRSLD